MTTRILLAAILGAVAMFIWNFIAHDLLPLGEAGIREIPNEQAILGDMQTNIGDKSGLYMFPGLGLGENPTREQKSEAMKNMNAKMATTASGLILYHPPGRVFSFGKLLGVEFVTEFIQVFLAVFLLAQTRINGYGGRVGFIFVAGILAAITTNVSYWNWYGFPSVYIASYMFIEVVGFLCAGIVAAAVIGKRAFGSPA